MEILLVGIFTFLFQIQHFRLLHNLPVISLVLSLSSFVSLRKGAGSSSWTNLNSSTEERCHGKVRGGRRVRDNCTDAPFTRGLPRHSDVRSFRHSSGSGPYTCDQGHTQVFSAIGFFARETGQRDSALRGVSFHSLLPQ